MELTPHQGEELRRLREEVASLRHLARPQGQTRSRPTSATRWSVCAAFLELVEPVGEDD